MTTIESKMSKGAASGAASELSSGDDFVLVRRSLIGTSVTGDSCLKDMKSSARTGVPSVRLEGNGADAEPGSDKDLKSSALLEALGKVRSTLMPRFLGTFGVKPTRFGSRELIVGPMQFAGVWGAFVMTAGISSGSHNWDPVANAGADFTAMNALFNEYAVHSIEVFAGVPLYVNGTDTVLQAWVADDPNSSNPSPSSTTIADMFNAENLLTSKPAGGVCRHVARAQASQALGGSGPYVQAKGLKWMPGTGSWPGRTWHYAVANSSGSTAVGMTLQQRWIVSFRYRGN